MNESSMLGNDFPMPTVFTSVGDAWLTLPVVTRLETEFGNPVVTNQTFTGWYILTLLTGWQLKPNTVV
jgi:maleate cis-trans isomerase